MSTFTGGDNHAGGQSRGKSIYPGTVKAIKFDTAVSPGANIPVAVKLTDGDLIPLCWIPEDSHVVDYNISIADLDAGTDLVMDLQDGASNKIQTGLTVGQSAGKITGADADVNVLGLAPATARTKAENYIQLEVTTTANTVHVAAARISGWVSVMGAE